MGQRKNLSPRQESNPWPPEHRVGPLSTELQELRRTRSFNWVHVWQASCILIGRWKKVVNLKLGNQMWTDQHDISMEQKKKPESPTGIEHMTSWTRGRRSFHWATRTHGERGHLAQFMCDMRTAYCQDQNCGSHGECGKWIKMVNFKLGNEIYHTHDDFDSADPSSMQDTCHRSLFKLLFQTNFCSAS